MNNEQFWKAVLGNLELSISKPNFTTWFKNTRILNSEAGDVTIGVPNSFTKEWLQNKYHQSIIKAIRAINPDIRQVRYIISTNQPTTTSTPANNPQTAESTDTKTAAPVRTATAHAQLNPKYNFQTFIVGRTNELAHAASIAVSDKPGTVYNPLFIYGGVGLGKTHLMQAVGNKITAISPRGRVMYVSSERFTNEFIQAVKDGRAYEFKDRYRNVDVLLIDDIQLLAGKEQTQEEFFHTFNALYNHNKQIVITADRLPKEIPSIEERLVSRFEGGMVADVQLPDYEMRLAILRSKSKERNYLVSEEILNYLAERIESNIRELEGALNRLMVYCQINNTTPSLDQVKTQIDSIIIQPKRRGLTSRKIMETVAVFYNVTIDDLIRQSRKKEYVKPRQIAMYLIRRELGTSLPSIGEIFGGRDHTTVIHAIDKVETITKDKDAVRQELVIIMEKVYL